MGFARPDKLPRWATAMLAVVTEPTEAKKDAGWTESEKPPNFFFNWLLNRAYQWFGYLDERAGLGIFGDGSGGDNTLSNGGAAPAGMTATSATVFTMNRDFYANNLTINSGIQLRTNGFRLYVLQTLTLTSDGVTACIACNGSAGAAGAVGNAPGAGGAAGGVGGSIGAAGSGVAGTGGAGGNNTPGVGAAGGNQTLSSGGGGGGAGHAGGGGTTAAGGAGGTASPGLTGSILNGGIGLKSPPTLTYGLVAIPANGVAQAAGMSFLQGGAGGGGGGGSSTNNVSGSGGGGGGGVVFVVAQELVTSGAGPHLQAKGGDGGPGVIAGLGFGGGGGSGGGGMIYLAYSSQTAGPAPVTDVTAGATSGSGSSGGTVGNPGVALVFPLAA